jgi:excisionase family DNA binding protein
VLEEPAQLVEARHARKTKDRPGGRGEPELPALPFSREAIYRDFGGRASLPKLQADGTNPTMSDPTPCSATCQRPPRTEYRLAPDKAAVIRTMPPLVMDLKEASAYLVCSPRKLRDLVATHRVKHAYVGRKIVIRREWLDAFLDR